MIRGGGKLTAAKHSVDLTERRVLFDSSWPLMLVILTGAYMVAWALELLAIDLSTVLWTTFALAIGYSALSRSLDFVSTMRGVMAFHVAINIIAVTGLAWVWSMLGGLASPAFALFFALPVVALGLVVRLGVQYSVTAYTLFVAWAVALRDSPELRLKLEQLGVPALWEAVPGFVDGDLSGYGVIAGGAAQLQFMLVFSFALIGVATTSAIVVELIHRLFERLQFVTATGERAEKISESFVHTTHDMELLLDRDSEQIIAVSPRFAEVLHESPRELIGCHYTTVLPFEPGHPLRRLIESGESGRLTNEGLATPSGLRLVNIRTHSGESEGYEFQRITFTELTAKEYAQIAVDLLGDLYGAIDGDGKVLYLSDALAERTGVEPGERADRVPLPAGWWQIGTRRQHTRRVPLNEREFDLRLKREEYFGDREFRELIVFRLTPAGSQ